MLLRVHRVLSQRQVGSIEERNGQMIEQGKRKQEAKEEAVEALLMQVEEVVKEMAEEEVQEGEEEELREPEEEALIGQ